MRKRLSGRSLAAVLGTAVLTASMVFTAFPAAADDADDTDEDVEFTDEDWDDEDLMIIDDSADLEIDEELSPEEEELYDFIDANLSSEIMEHYDSMLYKQTMYNDDGSENSMTGYVYRDKDLIYVSYVDGYAEKITEDVDEGFDPDLGSPVRYIFGDEEIRQDSIDNYEELFYLWGMETVAGRTESDGKVTFITENDDMDFIDYMIGDLGGELEEGKTYKFSRETVFDKESKLLVSSAVSLAGDDGSSDVIFECSLQVNPENGYEEDKELFAKLDSEDTHSLKVVIDPNTEDETVLEGKVGKGCVFYPLIYDGYTYYTDEECTLVATEEELYEKEKDVVLYAAFEEIPEEDYDLEDGEFELEFDEGDEIDLSELFEDQDLEGEIAG